MRRRIAVPLLTGALLLPGTYGGTAVGADGRFSVAGADFPEIAAGRKFGQEPTIVTRGRPPSGLRSKVLSAGGGRPVRSGEVLVADFKGQVWADPSVEIPPFENTFQTQPIVKLIGTGAVVPAWDRTIPGVTVGSRVVLVAPPAEALGSTGSPRSGIRGVDTVVFVIDVIDAFSRRAMAAGTKVTPRKGLPRVGYRFDPRVTMPAREAPEDLVSRFVIRGTGPVIRRGQTVVVHYKGLLWRNGKRFDTSWSGSGRPLPLGFHLGSAQIIRGWNKGLVGKRVGSRVLLVIPPRLAYGKAGNKHAGIGPTDAIVFAVDILRAY